MIAIIGGPPARFAQVSIGALPHARAMRAIELFGSEVAPVVRQALAARAGSPAG